MNDRPTQKAWEDIPFGAMEVPPGYSPPGARSSSSPASTGPREAPAGPREAPVGRSAEAAPAKDAAAQRPGEGGEPRDWRKPENRRGRGRRGGRRRRHGDEAASGGAGAGPAGNGADGNGTVGAEPGVQTDLAFEGDEGSDRGGSDRGAGLAPASEQERDWDEGEAQSSQGPNGAANSPHPQGQGGARRRRRRGRRGRSQGPFGGPNAAGEQGGVATAAPPGPGQAGARPHPPHPQQRVQERQAPQVLTGMLVLEKGGWGVLRRLEAQYLPSKDDIWVPQHLIQRFKLREGSLITGPCGRGQQHKFQLNAVDAVDGKDPRELMNLAPFKKLVSIDPDFHYAVGDIHGDASMRVIDLIAPVGRGSRGLIVAPPRSGKTILMRKFANAITDGYPDVHLIVLLVDERPEEATEWQRTTKGQVFVSTNDEDTKNHVELAEAVFRRCQRLVELGQDVVLLLDSITRLARAFNNHLGTSGKTMSGGLDSRAMERPRSFFGMARNTETAGSLTILGTTLVETGSRLDQLVFEEFKGTGNLEIVLSRKLADRRIFPAIDIERSGTRKEEKLLSAQRLKRTHVLRRVLLKMNFIEAMELLSTKLEEVDKTDDFLKRFDVDPDA